MSQSGADVRRYRWFFLFWILATLSGFALPTRSVADTPKIPNVVATIQDETISAEELTEALRSEFLRLELERYQLMKKKLDELIATRLMRLEATKRNISVSQLEQEEITAKVATITPEQIKTFYEANKSRIRQPLEQITPRIEAYLQRREQEKRQQAFLRDLRQRYPVTVALQPPTVPVSADDDPFQGPADAPVTIIEFSDFQCPYCRRVQPALKRLMADYQGKIKLVFRDFPLRRIHPQAQKAAEAAQCAAEQQNFWPYHDKLFVASSIQITDLKQYAKELGLDVEQFNTCLDSSKYAGEVEADLQDGTNAGVNATPSFFVNGQPVNGAIPYERFKELVDTALAQHQNAKRANP